MDPQQAHAGMTKNKNRTYIKMTDNQDKHLQNIPLQNNPPDVWQQTVEPVQQENYYDEYQGYHGMNRFMLMLILASMIPWFLGSYVIFGFNVTGWAWVIPLIVSALLCLRNISQITFPIFLWLFWMSMLLVNWFWGRGNPFAHQSLFQTLSPIVIGCAASTFRPDNRQLENIIRWLSRLAVFAWLILIIRLPMILFGRLPGHGFMAAEMIGLLFLGACYASFYACGSHRYLYYYLSMVAITFVTLVRGPMTAMLSCMPLTLAPLSVKKRFILIILVAICAFIIFNTDRVQQRMFQSGGGEIADIRLNNPNFKTTARTAMWDVLWYGVREHPWLGNGWNMHRTALLSAGFPTYAPHNDWLKLWHDIGIIGIGLYLITMLLQVFFLVRIARFSTGAHQMLAYGAATAFIPYMLIMLTDNVVLYVQFFGNLHFALIGSVYGATIHDEVQDYA